MEYYILAIITILAIILMVCSYFVIYPIQEEKFISVCLKDHLIPIQSFITINNQIIPITNYIYICDESEIILNPKYKAVFD